MKHKIDTDKIHPVRHRGLYDWLQSFVGILLPIILLLTFVGHTIEVRGNSMMPTFLDSEQVIVRSIFYTPRRGDVIVFSRYDILDGANLVKRVIALAGDVVDINTVTGVVYVNGVALDEPYTEEPTNQAGNVSFPYTVPHGHIFVLGDNRSRNGSLDSRHTELGSVDEREIFGHIVAVVLPLDQARLISRRGIQ